MCNKCRGFLVFQHWDVFRELSEVFILVPALVGLKGNLEMTLASRLSTAVSDKTQITCTERGIRRYYEKGIRNINSNGNTQQTAKTQLWPQHGYCI